MLVLGLGCAALAGDTPDLVQARNLYNHTEYQQSLKVLEQIAVKDAGVWALIGRNHYMEGDYKKATEALEKAAVADPANAAYALWLGRAFGRRAETASPFTAPGYAGKARQYFERSVHLNPKYLEALNDLFEYYLEAPGFLGGGSDKASATAARIAAIDPAEGYWASAKLAEKHKQFAGAEEQLRRAIASSPHQVGRVIDLARFLARQGRIQEADQSFTRAEAIEPNSPSLMYAKAATYIETKRKLDVAKELLKRYLSSALTPDDPPRADAVKLLRQAEGG